MNKHNPDRGEIELPPEFEAKVTLDDSRIQTLTALAYGLSFTKSPGWQEFSELLLAVKIFKARYEHLRQVAPGSSEEMTVPGSVVAEALEILAPLADQEVDTLATVAKRLVEESENEKRKSARIRADWVFPQDWEESGALTTANLNRFMVEFTTSFVGILWDFTMREKGGTKLMSYRQRKRMKEAINNYLKRFRVMMLDYPASLIHNDLKDPDLCATKIASRVRVSPVAPKRGGK